MIIAILILFLMGGFLVGRVTGPNYLAWRLARAEAYHANQRALIQERKAEALEQECAELELRAGVFRATLVHKTQQLIDQDRALRGDRKGCAA